jgi:branched-chain amino acid transport system substrate-binding protein
MKRIAALLLTATLAATGVAACGDDDEEEAGGAAAASETVEQQESGPIIIGQPASLSGPQSFYDLPIQAFMKLAIEDVNSSGGVGGRQLELITADNKTNLELVQSTTQSVLDKDADIIIPTCDYDIGGPAARLAQENGIVSITCAGSPLHGKEGIGDLAFNSYQANPTEVATMVGYAAEQGWKRPYLIQDTSLEYSKNLCDEIEKFFPQAVPDGEIAGKDTFQNPDQSVEAQVTRLRNNKEADSVMLCSYLPGGATALRQMRSAGIDLPVFGGIGFDGRGWTEAIPNISDFYYPAVVSIAGDDPEEKVNEITKRFEEETGDPVEASIAFTGYANIEMIKKGVEAAGTTEGEKLAEAFEQFKDEPLVTGPTTYTDDCHIPLGRPMRVMQWRDGELSLAKLVETTERPESPC